MKTFYRIILITACILIVGGIIMSAVAFILGVSFRNLDFTFFNENRFESFSEEYENVTAIDFDIDYSNVYIKTGDTFKIEAENINKSKLKSEVSDGVWKIKYDDNKIISFFSFIHDIKITVYLPENFEPESAKISIGAGALEADKLVSDNLSLAVGAGQIKIDNIKTADAKIECNAGEINIRGKITGDSKIKCDVGAIKLSLIGDKDDYNYSISVGIGELNLNGSKYSGISNNIINNDGAENNFDIDCEVGEINLQIKKD